MALCDFETAVRAAVDAVALPGIAFGISRGRETILLGATGLADKAGIEATSQIPFALASVTKPMTATAVAILAEEGRVDLDAPIGRYLGGMKLEGKAGDPAEATVRRVANHTAGLPLHYRFYYADQAPDRRPFPEVVARYGKLFNAPGRRHHYSNLGYGLLDALIAEVSGTDYATFMRERVFDPLGMTRSSIGPSTKAAVGYRPDGAAYPIYDTDHPGGSAAFASVEDLLTFGRFHLGLGPSILSIQSREAMQVPTFDYGLGWSVAQRHGVEVVSHSGSMGGVSTVLRLVPSLDLVVALVANGEGIVPSRLADHAIAAFDETYRDLLGKCKPTEARLAYPFPEGIWSGHLETSDDRLPFALEIGPREVLVRLDGAESFVENPSFSEGRLIGKFDGDLQISSEIIAPYRLHLDLELQTSTLRGAVAAINPSSPNRRVGDALSFWSELGVST